MLGEFRKYSEFLHVFATEVREKKGLLCTTRINSCHLSECDLQVQGMLGQR